MSVLRRGGCWDGVYERGLGGIPMEGMIVEMDRSGVSDTSIFILSILKFACAFVQADQSFLFTFKSIK